MLVFSLKNVSLISIQVVSVSELQTLRECTLKTNNFCIGNQSRNHFFQSNIQGDSFQSMSGFFAITLKIMKIF